MTTDVSPFCHASLRVVMVRVTLQLVAQSATTANAVRPQAKFAARPALPVRPPFGLIDFLFIGYLLSLVLRLIVLLTAHLPEVSLHRLLAVGVVALCEEVNLVLGDLGQVFLTCRYHRTYRLETLTSSHLFRFERRGTLVAVCVKRIHALAVLVGAGCLAMNGYEVIAVVVTVLFLRSFHGAADGLDTGCAYFHNCHRCSAFAEQTASLTDRVADRPRC